MMELALELGSGSLESFMQMKEREFQAWQRYAGVRMLPTRRVELYLAQIAYWIARTMGGVEDASITDYMFLKDVEEVKKEVTEEDLETAKVVFDFKPRIRKKAA